MKDKREQKEFIVGDIHGSSESIQKTLKDVGFEIPQPKNISLSSPTEQVPPINNTNIADIIKDVRESMERRDQANVVHHDAQYDKMYPKKPK